jgi:hypothetical protein
MGAVLLREPLRIAPGDPTAQPFCTPLRRCPNLPQPHASPPAGTRESIFANSARKNSQAEASDHRQEGRRSQVPRGAAAGGSRVGASITSEMQLSRWRTTYRLCLNGHLLEWAPIFAIQTIPPRPQTAGRIVLRVILFGSRRLRAGRGRRGGWELLAAGLDPIADLRGRDGG